MVYLIYEFFTWVLIFQFIGDIDELTSTILVYHIDNSTIDLGYNIIIFYKDILNKATVAPLIFDNTTLTNLKDYNVRLIPLQ